jgi:hypothetical protein
MFDEFSPSTHCALPVLLLFSVAAAGFAYYRRCQRAATLGSPRHDAESAPTAARSISPIRLKQPPLS